MQGSRLKLICSGITAGMRNHRFPDDGPLEPQSKKLAVTLRTMLPSFPKRVLSGPSLRARETSRLLGLEPALSPMLRDQDYGGWSGKDLEEVEAAFPGALSMWLSDPKFAPAAGESIQHVMTRAQEIITSVADLPGTTIAVTHGPVIRALVLCVLGAPATSFWNIDAPPLSITELTFDGSRWALRMVDLARGPEFPPG